ncbi:hypothetical protein PAHAL_7G155400 [Panicum hallii]|uniref:Uncharacterized protein n=1 Tax=Panicum hallii TaxID=206008 RepID=A0A2S3I6V7_9POAL|nr:hypothetical protein PAHAL_7G155400 [Panicum hallii]
MAMVSPSPAARSAAAAASCCFSASSGGPFVVTRRPCFPADLGVGGTRQEPSSSSSLACSPRAGSTPEYAPSSPSRRAGSPEYTPLTPSSRGSAPPDYADYFDGGDRRYDLSSPPRYSPRAASPEYTPLSYADRAGSPDPERTPLSPSPQPAASPDYTPSSPSGRAASPEYSPATPEYTPESPSQRAAATTRTRGARPAAAGVTVPSSHCMDTRYVCRL